jgi:predicted transcriptional regulator of viral defense system
MKLRGEGSVFTLADFYDLGETYTVQKALQRMSKDGTVERVGRGLYLYPKFGELLKKNIPASVDEVARAIARRFAWTITPNGENALNYLGLSTQVPAVPLYFSNGPSRIYTYGKFNIQFKNRASREIAGKSYKSRLVIQALKALGEDSATKEVERKIKQQLNEQEKLALIDDTRNAAGWIRNIARRIAQGGDSD